MRLGLQISLLTEHELTKIAMAKQIGVRMQVEDELAKVQKTFRPMPLLDRI
jgi:hypothetical protein